MQAICIVASKHANAAKVLLLGNETQPLSPREFSQRLYQAVIVGIEAKLEKNRVVLIQVLALISLHCEGPDGAEQASMHLAQAIHHAHTFGLQFGHQWRNQSSESQGNLEDVFWCLWSLDKINACMNGRPLLMHDRDNSLRQLPTDPEKRSSPFGIWLQISEMLDKVIDYYRPGSRSADETGWEDDFLGFEEMVGDGEDKLDGPIMSESDAHDLFAQLLIRKASCRSSTTPCAWLRTSRSPSTRQSSQHHHTSARVFRQHGSFTCSQPSPLSNYRHFHLYHMPYLWRLV